VGIVDGNDKISDYRRDRLVRAHNLLKVMMKKVNMMVLLSDKQQKRLSPRYMKSLQCQAFF